MKPVPDRKKLRREYLRKKASSYLPALWFEALVGLPCALMVIAMIYRLSTNPPGWDGGQGLFGWISSIIGILIFGCGAYFGLVGATRTVRRGQSYITYVPPITPNTLPADEILVRGSDEPLVAQSEVLLRAAKEQETPKEELLRVSQE